MSSNAAFNLQKVQSRPHHGCPSRISQCLPLWIPTILFLDFQDLCGYIVPSLLFAMFFTLKSTSSQGQVILPNWSLYGSGILLVTIRGTHKQNTAFAIQSIYTRLRMGTVAVSISQVGGPKDEKTPGIRDVDCRFYWSQLPQKNLGPQLFVSCFSDFKPKSLECRGSSQAWYILTSHIIATRALSNEQPK